MKHYNNVKLAACLSSALFLAQPGYPASNQPAPGSGLPTTVDARSVLASYQLALDQLSSGRLVEARVVLEDGIRRYGNQPELTLLLAYVLEREGRAVEARDRLASTAPTSPVAAAYVAALSKAAATTAGGVRENEAGVAAAPGGGTPGGSTPGVTQSDARLGRLEQMMAQLVNNERAQAGLNPLAFDSTLATVARGHSAEMRDRKYFAHESPVPGRREPLDRYRAVFAKAPMVLAENVHRSWSSARHEPGEDDVRKGHAGLMKSPGHRANILRSNVTHIGIGIAVNANGDIWITQMFARP